MDRFFIGKNLENFLEVQGLELSDSKRQRGLPTAKNVPIGINNLNTKAVAWVISRLYAGTVNTGRGKECFKDDLEKEVEIIF